MFFRPPKCHLMNVAAKHGFTFHHAKTDYVLMTLWMIASCLSFAFRPLASSFLFLARRSAVESMPRDSIRRLLLAFVVRGFSPFALLEIRMSEQSRGVGVVVTIAASFSCSGPELVGAGVPSAAGPSEEGVVGLGCRYKAPKKEKKKR